MDRPVKWGRTARNHRVGRAHVLFVINHGDPEWTEVPGRRRLLSWIGTDATGRELEIIAVDFEDWVVVIHAMPTKYRRKKGP